MACSTTERVTYTLTVDIKDKDMRTTLRNGGYRLRVGDAHGDSSKFRKDPPCKVIHPKKQPLVGTELSVHATFDVDPVPVPQYWIGYITEKEPGRIQEKRKVAFGQVYLLGMEGVKVSNPHDKDWVPARGFGFQNIITAAPVVLQEDPDHPGCTPPDSMAMNFHQCLWVPGVGIIEPLAIERKLAVWFENGPVKGSKVRTGDQSLMYKVEWYDFGDAASRKLKLWYSKVGVFADHEDPDMPKPVPDVCEPQNKGFQPEEEYQNKGFQPQKEEYQNKSFQLEEGESQNQGFQPEDEDSDYQNKGFHFEEDESDHQNEGFQPAEEVKAPEPEPSRVVSKPQKPVNGTSGGKLPHRGSRMKVTMMNGFF